MADSGRDGERDSPREPKAVVVLIEDEKQIRRFVRQALEAEGLQVHEADHVEQGLLEAATRQPDLVILDLGLPGRDGLEFIRDFRGWSEMPIVVLSARVEETAKIAALDAGADDYLTKPFSFDVLLARIRARTRQAGQAQPLRFGDLVLDPGTREASRGPRTLTLTRTEFAILECLVRAAGRVVPRDRLIEDVWGDRDVTYNNLEVFIRLLRSKVDGDGQAALIHTERGIGYVLRSRE